MIETKPKYFRAAKATGKPEKVDRKGGMYGAGVIRGVSAITRGEALGHDMWVDGVFLGQVADAINAPNKGVKSRFTHPGMSGDGLGRHLGRLTNARVEGDQVVADQHFSESAHDTPDGDLAGYLMALAEEDPEAYGLSIVFEQDLEAMVAFLDANQRDGEFISPDPGNVDQYPHARLGSLRAADAVDEPAANPGGLFHRDNEIFDQANALASYALGLTTDTPVTTALNIDPERAKGFLARFLTHHNLEVKPIMADDTKKDVEEITEPVAVADAATDVETDAPTEEVAEETAAPVAASNGREEARRFQAAFGEKGAVWYAEGLSFEEARNRQIEELTATIEDRDKTIKEQKTLLAAASAVDGEEDAVELTAGEAKGRKGFASKIKFSS